jgi:hypothetical protein
MNEWNNVDDDADAAAADDDDDDDDNSVNSLSWLTMMLAIDF